MPVSVPQGEQVVAHEECETVVYAYSNERTNRGQFLNKKQIKYFLTRSRRIYEACCKSKYRKYIFMPHFLGPESQMVRNNPMKW